jgi:hypothetical protein
MRAAVGLSFLFGCVRPSAGQETERFRGPDPFCQDECIDGGNSEYILEPLEAICFEC